MDKIKVLVADDHPIFRAGLENVIRQSERIELVALAEDGLKALELILELKPDVAVLDIQMPGMNGIKVCEQVMERKLSARLALLTLYKERELYNKAISIGVSGYLLKETASYELIACIEALAAGRTYHSLNLEDHLVNERLQQLPERVRMLLEKLSNTEKKIVLLISRQKSTKEIAAKLFVSEKTIENHRYNIAKKLELTGGQNTLLKFAMEHSGYLSSL